MRSLLLIAFLASGFMYSACKKEVSITNNPACDTVRIHDTIRIRDTVYLPQMPLIINLTQKQYRLEELAKSVGGVISEFMLGGVNNTGSTYQNMRFKFNADFTGTYIDENNGPHTLNWAFTNSAQTRVSLTIGPPYANVFNWRMLEVKGDHLTSTTIYGNELNSARWVQIP